MSKCHQAVGPKPISIFLVSHPLIQKVFFFKLKKVIVISCLSLGFPVGNYIVSSWKSVDSSKCQSAAMLRYAHLWTPSCLQGEQQHLLCKREQHGRRSSNVLPLLLHWTLPLPQIPQRFPAFWAKMAVLYHGNHNVDDSIGYADNLLLAREAYERLWSKEALVVNASGNYTCGDRCVRSCARQGYSRNTDRLLVGKNFTRASLKNTTTKTGSTATFRSCSL